MNISSAQTPSGYDGHPRNRAALFILLLASAIVPSRHVAAASEGAAPPAVHMGALTVTAQKRSEELTDIPASVSILTDMQLEDSGVDSIVEMGRHLPNLNIINEGTGGRSSYLYLRGVGSAHNEPALGFHVDDLPYFNEGVFDMDLFDVERVEVLRGPQGTLYGRNTLGGVIKVITKAPGNRPEAEARLSMGDHDRRELRLAVRGPVIDNRLFMGFSGSANTRDGYTHNDVTGTRMNLLDEKSGRLRLRWLPAEGWEVNLTGSRETADNDGFGGLNPPADVNANPHHVRLNMNGGNDKVTSATSLRVDRSGTAADVTAILTWSGWDNEFSLDSDYSDIDLVRARIKEDQRYTTFDLRLASPGGHGPLQWLGGVYWFDEALQRRITLDVIPAATTLTSRPDFDNRGHALFGQVTYTLFDRLDVTFGLRHDREEKGNDMRKRTEVGGVVVADTTFNDRKTYTEWLPKLAVSYHLSPATMGYASVARGHRSGGFNVDFVNQEDASFDPEQNWNHELGIRHVTPNQRLRVNAALFLIEMRNQQVQLMLPDGNTPFYRNAAKSRSRGIELEGNWWFAEQWEMDFGYGYTHARFLEFSDPQTGADHAGKHIPLVPEHSVNWTVQHRRPLFDDVRFFGQAELTGQGDVYWDDANRLKESFYFLTNLRLGLEWAGWDLYVWAKNLFDRTYENVGFATSLGDRISVGPPRMIGTSLTARY